MVMGEERMGIDEVETEGFMNITLEDRGKGVRRGMWLERLSGGHWTAGNSAYGNNFPILALF